MALWPWGFHEIPSFFVCPNVQKNSQDLDISDISDIFNNPEIHHNPSGSSIAASAELPCRCQSSMQFGQRDLSNPQGRYQGSQVRRYVQKYNYVQLGYLKNFTTTEKLSILGPWMKSLPSRWTYPCPSLGPKRWWRDWAWPQLWRCKHAPPNPKCQPLSLANQRGCLLKSWHAFSLHGIIPHMFFCLRMSLDEFTFVHN